MKHVVIGAGQIGSALVEVLRAGGGEVVVIRRSDAPVDGARVVASDLTDHRVLEEEFAGASAVHHCIRAPYDHRAWRRELVHRELRVMDVAAALGVPVIFPESVYAFGRGAADLYEGAKVEPCSPLGEVRAELLEARARHVARTASIVASDLFGPTANDGSVATVTMLRPLTRGRRAWVPADLDTPHSWTYLPDLAQAMVHAATHIDELGVSEGASRARVLHAPTGIARSCRQLVRDAGVELGRRAVVRSIPEWPLAAGAHLNVTARELHAQRYLWRRRAVLHPGVLTTEAGLRPTPWADALRESLAVI